MQEPTLEARVARLERLVEEMHRAVIAGGGPTENAAAPTAAAAPRPAAAVPTAAPGSSDLAAAPSTAPPPWAAWRTRIWDGEMWLNRLGIGLLLFGVTFLFKYSIDQGWLTPAVRVGFGAMIGGVLLGAGLWVGERQRSLSQALLGGGIGIFYIVGFAAFQLYDLVGYATAFAFMTAVTVAAFLLALRANHPLLSLIGVQGALGTPFLLYSGAGNFPWLIGYTCLVVASAVGLLLVRGWRSVLWTAILGGWSVLLVAHANSVAGLDPGVTYERWILQGAALLFWFALGVVPALWEGRAAAGRTGPLPRHLWVHVHLTTVVAPLAAAGITALAWPGLGWSAWGWGVVAAGAAYAAVAALLRDRRAGLASAHLLAAALLVPLGTVAALSGEALLVALAAQAAALHAVTRRARMPEPGLVAPALFVGCAVWFLVRLDVAGIAGTSRALADLAVIALAMAASFAPGSRREVQVFRFAVHGALLALMWRELVWLPGGAGLVSAAWGAYAIALLVAGLKRGEELLQRTALATLILVVAKLFVVDLAALEAIWRILLFLGLGAVMLTISFLLREMWAGRRPGVAGS